MIEREELERLIAENAKPLFRYCLYRLGGNEDLTEQTVSDVWLVLVKKSAVLRGGKDMRAFLYRTADRCIKHNIDKHKRRLDSTASFDEWKTSVSESTTEDDYFKDDRSDDELLEETARKLPEEQRELFRMRFIEKMKLSEIVSSTGLPYSSVRYRIELLKREVVRIVREE